MADTKQPPGAPPFPAMQPVIGGNLPGAKGINDAAKDLGVVGNVIMGALDTATFGVPTALSKDTPFINKALNPATIKKATTYPSMSTGLNLAPLLQAFSRPEFREAVRGSLSPNAPGSTIGKIAGAFSPLGAAKATVKLPTMLGETLGSRVLRSLPEIGKGAAIAGGQQAARAAITQDPNAARDIALATGGGAALTAAGKIATPWIERMSSVLKNTGAKKVSGLGTKFEEQKLKGGLTPEDIAENYKKIGTSLNATRRQASSGGTIQKEWNAASEEMQKAGVKVADVFKKTTSTSKEATELAEYAAKHGTVNPLSTHIDDIDNAGLAPLAARRALENKIRELRKADLPKNAGASMAVEKELNDRTIKALEKTLADYKTAIASFGDKAGISVEQMNKNWALKSFGQESAKARAAGQGTGLKTIGSDVAAGLGGNTLGRGLLKAGDMVQPPGVGPAWVAGKLPFGDNEGTPATTSPDLAAGMAPPIEKAVPGAPPVPGVPPVKTEAGPNGSLDASGPPVYTPPEEPDDTQMFDNPYTQAGARMPPGISNNKEGLIPNSVAKAIEDGIDMMFHKDNPASFKDGKIRKEFRNGYEQFRDAELSNLFNPDTGQADMKELAKVLMVNKGTTGAEEELANAFERLAVVNRAIAEGALNVPSLKTKFGDIQKLINAPQGAAYNNLVNAILAATGGSIQDQKTQEDISRFLALNPAERVKAISTTITGSMQNRYGQQIISNLLEKQNKGSK